MTTDWSNEGHIGSLLPSDLFPLGGYKRTHSKPNPRDNAARKGLRSLGVEVKSVSWVRARQSEFAIVTPYTPDGEQEFLDTITEPSCDIDVVYEGTDKFGQHYYAVGWKSYCECGAEVVYDHTERGPHGLGLYLTKRNIEDRKTCTAHTNNLHKPKGS